MEYLTLLNKLADLLDDLSELAQQKLEAVVKDDLMELDRVIKQEQAQSLALRGMDQQRDKAMQELELVGSNLRQLASRYPADIRPQAQETVERLRHSYDQYKNASLLARSKMESEIYQIERFLDAAGASGRLSSIGAGYGTADPEPPKAMKTDFRA